MKIGLIAMSGIRACDPALLELGLTLPGFVERSQAIASLPSLGLLTLAGMTPKRHQVRYLEVADLEQAEALPADFDLVAISSFTAQMPEAYQIARRYRAMGVPVVMGGLHVTMLPDEVQRIGAIPAIGEGELTWPRIVADAELNRLQPRYDGCGMTFDLAEAPMPAFELLERDRYNRLTLQTCRGCPWRCAFCASSILLTNRYKQKPIGRVLAEIDKICSLWRRPFIEFADDNTFVNRAYWRQLLPELAKRHIRWFTETDLSVSQDAELLDLMRQAGCRELLVGLESPSPAGLDRLELRRNQKKAWWPQYRDAIRRIQSRGIRGNACFVLGLDGQSERVFDDLYDFVEDACPYDVQITYSTPFPGTPLYNEFKRSGRLTHDGQWERYTLFDVNFVPSGMSLEELRTGFYGLARRLYTARFTKWRRDQFALTARDNHRRRPGSTTFVTRDRAYRHPVTAQPA